MSALDELADTVLVLNSQTDVEDMAVTARQGSARASGMGSICHGGGCLQDLADLARSMCEQLT